MQHDASINIDLSYLHAVTGGDKVFEKMLLTNAVTDIQKNIDNLQEAWQQQNAAGVFSTAHSLKSVTAIAGLPQIESLCKVIDNLFKDGIFYAQESATFSSIVNGWLEANPKLQAVIDGY